MNRAEVLDALRDNLELSDEVESAEIGPNGLVIVFLDGSEWLVPKPRQVRAATETEEDDDDEDEDDEDEEEDDDIDV